MNASKTQMLHIEQNTTDALDQDRQIVAFNDTQGNRVFAGNSMKVLGFTMNSRMSMDNHLSRMKSKMGIEYTKLKPLMSFMSLKDRKVIVNAKLRSILNYGLPIYMGESQQVRHKLEAAYMMVNKIIGEGLTTRSARSKYAGRSKWIYPINI